MQLANIAVYPADSTDFSHQGYGILSDVISAVVTEATADNNNVSQELEVTYPIGGTNVEYIKNTNMIRASTGTGADDYMIFEIYDYDENTDGTLSVHAQALPYRILKIPFDNGGIFDKFATVQLAINGGLSHVTGFPNWFHITSDVDVKQDFRKDQISNLGGMLDLILDRTECYVEYGWNYIKILKNRGKQITDVVLRDDSNVSGVQVVADYSNIINKIVPLLRARNAAGEYTDEPDYVGKIVTSKNPFKYIKYWSGMAAKFDGQEVADNYFVKEGVDQPKITATVNPLIIDDNLAAVKLFDSMQVYASKINYTATLKVVSRTFDALTCEVTDFKLGDKKKTLIDNNSTLSNIEDKINQANDTAQDAITSSNGKNTNYYSEDEPKNPVEGDTWFHTDDKGRPIIDQYIDGKWVQIVGHEKEDEVDKAIDQAQKDTEEAVKNANDAVAKADDSVAKADDAVAKAGFANNTATQAKSDAAAAGQQAKDALTSAGTAITDAKKALTDSGSAMVDSAQARKDSATAIKDAADSLTSAKDAINKVGNLTTSVTSQFKTVDNELKSKVNQTDYDKLKGTVTSQQTDISQNANSIKLKADKSYADTINNSVVKNTSSVGLLNDQIALTVSKTELNNTLSSYATQTWTQSQIKSTADSINLSVSKVQNNLDNLAIGGRNYILKSGTYTANMNTQTRMYLAESIAYFSEKSIALSCRIDFDNHIPGEKNRYGMETKFQGVDGKTYYASVWKNAVAGESFHGTIHALFNMPKLSPTNDLHEFWLYNQSATPNSTVTKPKIEIGTRATDWTEAPEDNATVESVSKIEVDLSGVKTTVANKADQSQVTQLANQISLKADTTALNELKGTVDKQGSEITLNTNSIKLKADQSSVNTLKGTVDKQGSAIDVNTKTIALKANQSAVDTLTGRVSTAEGKITVQAGQIAQTVSKNELATKLNGYATQTWTQGQIKVTSDNINLNVSKVQNEVNSIQVAGGNYIRNGNFEFGGANWRMWQPTTPPTGSYVRYQAAGPDWVQGTKGLVRLERPKGDTGSFGIAQDDISVVGGQTYVISFELSSTVPITLSIGDSGNGYPFTYHVINPIGHRRMSVVFVAPSTAKKCNVYFGFNGTAQSGTTWLSRIMMSQGNKAVDFIPNSTDYATQVEYADLEVKVNGIQSTVANKADKSQVTQLANQITSTVTALGNKADKSQITQLSNQITSTVDGLGTSNLVYNPSFRDNSLAGWLNTNLWYVSNLPVSSYNGVNGAGVNLTNVGTAGSKSFYFTRSKPYSDSSVGPTYYFSAYVKIYGETSNPVDFFLDFCTTNSLTDTSRIEYKDSNYAGIGRGSKVGVWYKLEGEFTPTKAHKYKSLSLYYATNGVNNVHAMFSRPMLSVVKNAAYTDQGPTASQITQMTDDINLRVKTDDVINQINISKEGILIDGKRTHITGTTTIDNAVIKDSMIQSITANKLTAGYINASIIKVYNIDVANLVGNKSSFIESNWNAISSYVNVNSNGINIGSGAGVLQLRSDGMHIIDNYKSEDVGLIHSNHVIYHPEINGLTFDLNVKGDYMAWGDESASGYDIKWAYSRTGSEFLGAGMNSYCDITVDPSKTIYTNKIARKYESNTAYLNLDRQKIGNNYDPSIGSAGTQLAFGGAGGIYLVNKVSNTYSAITDLLTNMSGLGTVHIPTSMSSDGKVSKWFTIKV